MSSTYHDTPIRPRKNQVTRVRLTHLSEEELDIVRGQIERLTGREKTDLVLERLIEILPAFRIFVLHRDPETGVLGIAALNEEERMWTADENYIKNSVSNCLLPELKGLLLYGPLGNSRYEAPDGVSYNADSEAAGAQCSSDFVLDLGEYSRGGNSFQTILESLRMALDRNADVKTVMFGSKLNLFSFYDKVVENNGGTLVVRERTAADLIIKRCDISIGDWDPGMDEASLPEDEQQALREVDRIIERAMPDNDLRDYVIRCEANILFRYDMMHAVKDYMLIVSSQNCGKSFIVWLAQCVGGPFVVVLDSSQVSNNSELNRRALINNDTRLHVVHEGRYINYLLLKSVWVAMDLAGSRRRGDGKFSGHNAVPPKLIRCQNTEDMPPRPEDDVLAKSSVIYELDCDGKRLLTKFMRKGQEIPRDAMGEPRYGYQLEDMSARTRIKNSALLSQALARRFIIQACADPEFSIGTSAPKRISDLKYKWNSLRGDGQTLIDQYENVGIGEAPTSDCKRRRVEVRMIPADDLRTIADAREQLVQQVADQLVEEAGAILRPHHVAERIRAITDEVTWNGIGGPGGDAAHPIADKSVTKSEFGKDVMDRFSRATGKSWTGKQRIGREIVNGSHICGFALQPLNTQ